MCACASVCVSFFKIILFHFLFKETKYIDDSRYV